ncbi:hypothetical protein PIB30_071810 [Stylosanthes scabra]|uniref:TF-B3 domain-containing protein n=1 Tax=Stylosanthes scabra TaxID=79078 RepID=A0ABU6RNU6_9FABA|nr:hypothetical protein [Stylosanthes scabra]
MPIPTIFVDQAFPGGPRTKLMETQDGNVYQVQLYARRPRLGHREFCLGRGWRQVEHAYGLAPSSRVCIVIEEGREDAIRATFGGP